MKKKTLKIAMEGIKIIAFVGKSIYYLEKVLDCQLSAGAILKIITEIKIENFV
jgi:hypothetical protein